MKSEAMVQAEVRKRAGELGIHVFRNNVGACEDSTGRAIRYGLANDSHQLSKRLKSSDLIGWTKDGKFLSVECKHEGWKMTGRPSDREAAQLRWISMVKNAGGVAGFVQSVEDFERLLNGV